MLPYDQAAALWWSGILGRHLPLCGGRCCKDLSGRHCRKRSPATFGQPMKPEARDHAQAMPEARAGKVLDMKAPEMQIRHPCHHSSRQQPTTGKVRFRIIGAIHEDLECPAAAAAAAAAAAVKTHTHWRVCRLTGTR